MDRCDSEILAELAPDRLIWAYCHGVFPMMCEGELQWFSPDPRGLLPLDEKFHVSRRLGWTMRRGLFEVTIDRCFADVMRLCADRPGETDAWISPEFHLAYGRLHEMGLAHSFEAWPAGKLGQGLPVGGLYGVAIGGAFFAESMFHTVTDAGKVALAWAVQHLRSRGFTLCDIQWTTANLRRFGAFDLPRRSFLRRLEKAVSLDCRLI